MTYAIPSPVSVAAQQYLQQVEAMRRELKTASAAIGRNSLAEFEGSLWQQEMLTSGMRRSLALLRTCALEGTVLRELQIATALLQQETRAYEGLIGQCGQTATLLRGLCTLHSQATSSPSDRAQALRCEA